MDVDHVVELALELRSAARDADERRLLVIAGDRDRSYRVLGEVLDALEVPPAEMVHVADVDRLPVERLSPTATGAILGRTRTLVVYDAHDELRPNAVGAVCGAIDGGGLFVLLAPDLDVWPNRRDAFDETLVVPPYGPADVTGRFRERFVGTLRAHPGIAIVAVPESGTRGSPTIVRRGAHHDRAAGRPTRRAPAPPPDHAFPAAAYRYCRTADQVAAVRALEALDEGEAAVVIEADRGRGKSTAGGIAAASLAAGDRDVLVTAPAFDNAREVFTGAKAVLDQLGYPFAVDHEAGPTIALGDGRRGRVRFRRATDVDLRPGRELPQGRPDVVLVDEAAALPVRTLEGLLAAGRVAFLTTIHGYEGAGRGFSVRFRDRLQRADLPVIERRLEEPIRFAPGDPLEVWCFNALLLDARPPVDELVEEARAGTCTYRRFPRRELADNERWLREAFGLLVLAHYQTEPNDLARLLDAPNLQVRAMTHEGAVVAVALVAEEGGLERDRRRALYRGGRIRGHLLPDLLTGQLRDEEAGRPAGHRIVRIATHHAARSRGIGSRLLGSIRAEFGPDDDWLGAAYGATPDLVDFWRSNGFRAVHLSTSRNPRSGEHSAVMLAPTGPAGRSLTERHERWFTERFAAMLSDPLDEVDADVVRAVCRAIEREPAVELTERQWRIVAAAAFGPGLFDVDPGPFRRLALAALVDGSLDGERAARRERLLVRKVLQGWRWRRVVDELGFMSVRTCMLCLGRTFQPLVERYGGTVAEAERRRYDPDDGDAAGDGDRD